MADRLLPKSCMYGHTREDLEVIVGDDLSGLDWWMRGQTMTLCDGQIWVRNGSDRGGSYESTGCGPHGPVVYGHDLKRFLAGLPVID